MQAAPRNRARIAVSYNYDAFGNENPPDADDANPFRYCGEYYDTEAGLYYLRARYYDPTVGRFTQADTHWNTANMIYGDNPQKINERQDALGLKTYSYAPQISAVMQSGNLYVYALGNPVQYADHTGEFAFFILTALAGALIGGIGGAVYSYATTGEVSWKSVGVCATAGGLLGLAGGAVASMLATAGSATGITAIAGSKTVLSGLGIIGGNVAGGGTIVIGQTMSRVIEKAETIGASVYNGCAYYTRLSQLFGSKIANFIGKADNALWIINKMAQNYKIIDIGIDVNKALGSSSYILESILTFFYTNKEYAIEYFKGVF